MKLQFSGLNPIKSIVAIIISALLIWLFLSKNNDRKANINDAIRFGNFDDLADSTKTNLLVLIRELYAQTGVKQNVFLNAQFDGSPGLRFYVCSPKMIKATHCSKGNAIYDNELNAIFIDESLVSPTGWDLYIPDARFPINVNDLPFLKTYLQFIILHEIGHSILHKTSAGFFDDVKGSDPKYRKYEIQADSFAARTMAKAIEFDKEKSLVPLDIGSSIDLELSDTTSAGDKVLTAVAAIGFNVNGAMMFGPSPISPYQQDIAHPTFIERSINILDAVLQNKVVNSKFYSRALWVRACLESTLAIRSNYSLAEVTLPNPILNLAFDDKGIIVQPLDTLESIFRVDYEDINLKNKRGNFQKIAPEKIFIKGDSLKYEFKLDALYSFAGGEAFTVTEDGHLLRYVKNRLEPFTGVFDSVLAETRKQNPLQPEPADSILYFSTYRKSYCFSRNKSIKGMQHDSVDKVVQARFHNHRISLLWGDEIVSNNAAYLMVSESNDSIEGLIGVVAIDLITGSIKDIIRFNLFDKMLRELQTKFDFQQTRVLVDNEYKNNYYLVTSQLSGNFRGDFGVWQVFSDKKPLLQSMQPFIYKKASALEAFKTGPKLYTNSLAQLSPFYYLINWDNDLFYGINLNSKTVQPVFFPGAEGMRIRVSNKGCVAIYNSGLYKFYILNPCGTDERGTQWLIIEFVIFIGIILVTIAFFLKIKHKT